MRDTHNNVRSRIAIKPVAIGTTGTGQTGKIIDRQGYEGLEFLIGIGEVTATNATVTVTIKEGDATGTLTSVADADLLGTEAAAGLAAGVRASGTTKNAPRRIGYGGNKRYVQCNMKSTVTAGALISALALLTKPQLKPTANP